MRQRSAVAVCLLLAGALPALAAELGRVDFQSSGTPAAQAPFQRGVAALHNFWYDEAADAFREAQKIDPGFALAFWGEAMTYNHPIWGEQDTEAARGVLARAAKAPTEREKAWMTAVEVLYGEGDKPARDRAYAEAMRRLHERFPEDSETAIFYALSLIGPALTGGASDAGRERDLMRAAAILEELFDANPEHPGVLHYLIHAYDDPVHAPLALRAARTYSKVAPAAHHALHMPSHIFVQLGRWPEVAASNEAAWAASVEWVKRRGLKPEKRDFHSLSWLAYSYTQQGRLRKVEEVMEIARRSAAESDAQRIARALEEMQARYQIETRTWSAASVAAADVKEAEGHCGGAMKHPAASGAGLMAQGLGAARAGDLAVAERALAGLRDLNAGKEETYLTLPAKIMETEVAALILLAQGKRDDGLMKLREAVEMEERLPPPSGPPEPMKPAHELYGEVLLDLGKPEEAAAQFQKTLLRMPNRSAALLGAARAAVRLGNREAAQQYYSALATNWKDADSGLAELAEVRGFLNGVPAR